MIIVMVTGGKTIEHCKTGFKSFDSYSEAQDWCSEFNAKYSEEKYWHHAKVVKADTLYEVEHVRYVDGGYKNTYHEISEVKL
jgi:hypothetical protein